MIAYPEKTRTPRIILMDTGRLYLFGIFLLFTLVAQYVKHA